MKTRIYHNPIRNIEEGTSVTTSYRINLGGSYGWSVKNSRLVHRGSDSGSTKYEGMSFRIVRSK